MPVHRMTAGLRQGKSPVSETLLHDRSRGMEEVKGGLEESKGNATEGTGTALWRRTVPQSKAAILEPPAGVMVHAGQQEKAKHT